MSHVAFAPAIAAGRRFPFAKSCLGPFSAGSLALVALYFVGVEEGALSVFSGMYVHEFVHDGRHLLGFPCH